MNKDERSEQNGLPVLPHESVVRVAAVRDVVEEMRCQADKVKFIHKNMLKDWVRRLDSAIEQPTDASVPPVTESGSHIVPPVRVAQSLESVRNEIAEMFGQMFCTSKNDWNNQLMSQCLISRIVAAVEQDKNR